MQITAQERAAWLPVTWHANEPLAHKYGTYANRTACDQHLNPGHHVVSVGAQHIPWCDWCWPQIAKPDDQVHQHTTGSLSWHGTDGLDWHATPATTQDWQVRAADHNGSTVKGPYYLSAEELGEALH